MWGEREIITAIENDEDYKKRGIQGKAQLCCTVVYRTSSKDSKYFTIYIFEEVETATYEKLNSFYTNTLFCLFKFNYIT